MHQLLRAQLLGSAKWSGWLTKLGGRRRSWRRRFCILLPGQLRYYASDSLVTARGCIGLRERLYEQLRSPSFYPGAPTPFSFELGSGERSYVFCAATQPELEACVFRLSEVLNDSRWLRLTTLSELGSTLPEWPATPQAEAASSELIRLEIEGFSSVRDLALWPIGSSLQLLQTPRMSSSSAPVPPPTSNMFPDLASPMSSFDGLDFMDGDAPNLLGLVCDVQLHRARYTMSVSSAVDVVNETGTTLELTVERRADSTHSDHTQHEAEAVTIPPTKGSSQALPLSMTTAGSDEACWGAQVRVVGGTSGNSSDGGAKDDSSTQHRWGQLTPVPDMPGSAIVLCEPTDPSGAPWFCRVRIEPRPVGGADILSDPTGQEPIDGAAGPDGVPTAQALGFALPVTEAVLQAWRCTISGSSGLETGGAQVLPALTTPRGYIYATPGYLCYQRDGSRVRQAIAWHDVEMVNNGRFAHSIEIVLRNRRCITFGGLTGRDATCCHLRRIRLRARHEHAHGLSRWRPCRMRLFSPISISSDLSVPLLLQLIPGEDSANAVASSSALGTRLAPTSVVIYPGATTAVHTLPSADGVTMHLAISGASAPAGGRSLQGKMRLPPLSPGVPEERECLVQLADSSLTLSISLLADRTGSYGVRISALQLVRNLTSCPLRVIAAGTRDSSNQLGEFIDRGECCHLSSTSAAIQISLPAHLATRGPLRRNSLSRLGSIMSAYSGRANEGATPHKARNTSERRSVTTPSDGSPRRQPSVASPASARAVWSKSITVAPRYTSTPQASWACRKPQSHDNSRLQCST